jgi:hypothetical protein
MKAKGYNNISEFPDCGSCEDIKLETNFYCNWYSDEWDGGDGKSPLKKELQYKIGSGTFVNDPHLSDTAKRIKSCVEFKGHSIVVDLEGVADGGNIGGNQSLAEARAVYIAKLLNKQLNSKDVCVITKGTTDNKKVRKYERDDSCSGQLYGEYDDKGNCKTTGQGPCRNKSNEASAIGAVEYVTSRAGLQPSNGYCTISDDIENDTSKRIILKVSGSTVSGKRPECRATYLSLLKTNAELISPRDKSDRPDGCK